MRKAMKRWISNGLGKRLKRRGFLLDEDRPTKENGGVEKVPQDGIPEKTARPPRSTELGPPGSWHKPDRSANARNW